MLPHFELVGNLSHLGHKFGLINASVIVDVQEAMDQVDLLHFELS
jgi:hypothetical protein